MALDANTLLDLQDAANLIKNEKTPKANTAVRIGNMFLKLINAINSASGGGGGTVKYVNNASPDLAGNVTLSYVKTVNQRLPDSNGDVSLDNARFITQAGTVLDMAYGSQSAGSITNLVINELRNVNLLAEVTLKLTSDNNQAFLLTGTVSAAVTGVITGVATNFKTSLTVGSRIRLGGLNTYTVGSITSDTELRIVGSPPVQTAVKLERITADSIGGLLIWDSARQGKMMLSINGVANTPASINQVGGTFIPGRPHRVSIKCTQMPQLNTSLGYEFDVFISPIPQ